LGPEQRDVARLQRYERFELQNSSAFIRAAGGNGSSTPYQITDVYGLQGLATVLSNAELVNNIDASGTANWNSGAGFVPIGTDTSNYTGTFNGQNYTINGLYYQQAQQRFFSACSAKPVQLRRLKMWA